MKVILFLALASVALAGCKGEEEINTVGFYKANQVERDAKLDECRDNLAEALDDGNCINADAAAREVVDERREKAWEPGTNLGKPKL